jgi:hypothetical protein
VFQGLRAGAGSKATASFEYGKGLAPVIDFLAEDSRCRKSGLVDCYNAIGQGADPMTALLECVDGGEDDWLPDFFRQYLQGNIYSVAGSVFLDSKNISGTMNAGSDTLKEFTATYPDLSAKLYRVNLDADKLNDGSNISFEVDASLTNENYVTTQVYRIKDNTIEFISEALNVSVGGVKEAADQGYDLLCCVVNASNEEPYTGSSQLELSIHLEQAPSFVACRISLGVGATFQIDGDTATWDGFITPRWNGKGSMSGYTFVGEIDSTYHGNTNTHGTVSITLDPVSLSVTSFSADAQTIDEWGISSWGITGGAVPQTNQLPFTLTCSVGGGATCAAIYSFPWTYESTRDEEVERIISHTCSGTGHDAYLTIELYTQ